VIIQASHVGYDPETEAFGSYCRLQTTDNKKTAACGKIDDVLQWYQDEYRFAQNNIYLGQDGKGASRTLEQPEIIEMLMQQSTGNPDQIDLEAAIQQMIDARKVKIAL